MLASWPLGSFRFVGSVAVLILRVSTEPCRHRFGSSESERLTEDETDGIHCEHARRTTSCVAQRIRKLVCQHLAAEGHSVSSNANGLDGLSSLTADPPEVLVLDLGLPDLDGIDLLRMVRSVADLPVLVLTAREDEATILAALAEGADDYVVKPVSGPPRLTITDEGDGLPSTDVFDRGSSSGSSGLGLDIVRRVAEESGGGVTLGDSPGATIVVRFGEPVSPTEAR